MKFNIYIKLLFVSLLSVTAGCRKFVEVSNPIDKVTTSEVFSNDATATAAVSGIYGDAVGLNETPMNGFLSVYAGLAADDLRSAQPSGDNQLYESNILTSKTGTVASLWSRSYTLIYSLNLCIEQLATSTALSASTRTQLLGECKVMRAFLYFYLVNSFGDVPLETTSDYDINSLLPRTPQTSVYAQILNDLHDAQNLLTTAYPTGTPVRPNKWCATSLLARVNLYLASAGNNEKWVKADSAATAVINSGSYTLQADLNKVFLANSTEAIWQMIPVTTYPAYATSEAVSFLNNGTNVPVNQVTSFLLNAFETGDKRKTNWLTTINASDGHQYVEPYKLKVTSASAGNIPEYNMVLRYAEQYLIRAEAKTNEGDIAGAQADLNVIRNRAGLANTNATDKASLLTAISHERQTEFFAEWGHRWFDLKRTGKAAAILAAEKTTWPADGHSLLFPIALTDLNRNPYLRQNPGY